MLNLSWAGKFDKLKTRDGLFNLPDGTQEKYLMIPDGSIRVLTGRQLPGREDDFLQ